MITFWGLPVIHLNYKTPEGYQLNTITNAKAFELMHTEHAEADNDN